MHSPLHSQLVNPFRKAETLLDFPEIATLFLADDCVKCCDLLFELGRDKQVLAILDDLINREGASAMALLLKGKALRQQKRLAEAISCVRNAEMLEPDNPDLIRFLIECYVMQNRFEEELEYLQRLAELEPENNHLPRLIATAMDKAGRKEEALQLFFKLDYELAEDDEDHKILVSSIADTALALDKLDIAERYTEKELELFDGKRWEAHLRMGHIKLLGNDLKGCLDHYEQFVNNFGEQLVPEKKVALAKFAESWEMLISKGIKRQDLLLIYDILLGDS